MIYCSDFASQSTLLGKIGLNMAELFKQRRRLSMITEDVPAAGTQRPSQPSREDPVPKARALGVFDICQFSRL